MRFFAFLGADALGGEALSAGLRFLCFLLLNKLCIRRASRDYLQAYVVSFLMLVAGAALSSDLSYAGCFLAYVVFATWTLTLFHLRREMEENYLLKHSDGAQSERVEVERILNSRRIVGGAFLGATSVVSLGIFVVATMVFFLIPRFGFGFFVAHGRRGSTVVGFSDPLATPVVFGAPQPVAYELQPQVTASPIELEARGPGEVYAVERHVDPNGRVYGVERKSGLRYTAYSTWPTAPEAELVAIPDVPVARAADLA